MLERGVTSLRASLTAYEESFDSLAYTNDVRHQDLADGTKQAYADDLRHFTDWCARAGVETTPVRETVVLSYLYYYGAPPTDEDADGTCDRCLSFAAIREAEGDRILKVSTLSRRLIGIRSELQRQGWSFPAYPDRASNAILVTINHLKREQQYAPRKARAITQRLIAQMANACAEDPKGIRDRAMLLTAFLGGLRRSEVTGLDLDDVTFLEEGMRLRIRESKTDRLREGQYVYVPLTRHAQTCATRTVQRWLEVRGTAPGPLFQSLFRGGGIRGNRPDSVLVDELVRDYVKAVGGDPSAYSAHSLRSGFATSAARANAPVSSIKTQTRHRSLVSLDGYIQEGRAFEDNAVRFLDL